MSKQLILHIQRGAMGRRIAADGEELDPQLLLLRRWQAQRLAQTHQDLLQSQEHGRASRFFLTEVYGPKDYSQRDQDILQVYESMHRVLPPRLVRTLEQVIELNNLTKTLDDTLLHALVDVVGMTDTLTSEMYAEGYRVCDNYRERLRQIELLVAVGFQVGQLVRLPFIQTTLRLARIPARLAGWGELQDFLEEGFAAFKQMRHVDAFLHTIEAREKQILEQIYAGNPDPFAVDG